MRSNCRSTTALLTLLGVAFLSGCTTGREAAPPVASSPPSEPVLMPAPAPAMATPAPLPPPRPERSAEELAMARARAEADMRAEAERSSSARRDAERAERAAAERAFAERAASAAPAAAAPPTAAPAPPNPNVAAGAEFFQVRVFYGTDRRLETGGVFGGRRGDISYGSVFVSVPKTHEVGAIERPSLWRLEFSEDPRKHMVILRRRELARDDFFADIRDTLARGGSEASFVFVHGYNVAFDDAARRTAQITYDLDFHGAPVFYSWPSQATLEGYTIDESNVEWSQANLKNFLLDYARSSGAKDIYLIAHSMGNRSLTRAVSALFAEHPEMRGRFKEIILTAPDIDADVFKRDIAPALIAGCDKITLYVSNGDKALLASKKIHGYPRLGDSADGIVVVRGIETIDASGLDTSFLEHSYFAETSSVLTDIRRLVREGLRAAQRGLQRMDAAGAGYWKILTRPE